jgi:hypothetical protein
MRRLIGRAAVIVAIAWAAILLPGAGAGAGAALPRAHAAAPAPCSFAHTEIWLGDGEGGGAAGHTYYPLEFSNIGHSRCSLYGFPGVSAVGASGKQIGGAAARSGSASGTVTLSPGATAHALLAIADWGAICAKGVNAFGLRIYAPGQHSAQQVQFSLQVCAGPSVLLVGPLRPGVGVPGYTDS